MVRARIRLVEDGTRIEIQRAKFKHWFLFGAHPDTNAAFRAALEMGAVRWDGRIIGEEKLF